jgi:phosphoribosylformylglycinamidine cyclo-ligase
MDKQTYASAGVDVTAGELFVERLKAMSRRSGHNQTWKACGSYAAVYPMAGEHGIAVTTDGVGTKLLVAQQLNRHDTIGIDLVAMCANDLICVGATPKLFLDYFAIGKLDNAMADQIMSGIVNGCDQAGMLLVGGETAEMPGVYEGTHYDLAGFAVGDVSREALISGEKIKPGQKVIGIASNGIHSNGLSLARKVLADNAQLWESLLLPTVIYVQPVLECLKQYGSSITGIAHITGGGWRNLFRLHDDVGFHINNPLPVPKILQAISSHVPESEMYSTFNMGMGLAIIADDNAELIAGLCQSSGFTAQIVGTVTDQVQTLTIAGSSTVLKG